VIAVTARHRKNTTRAIDPRDLQAALASLPRRGGGGGGSLAVMFGSEKNGLTSEEISVAGRTRRTQHTHFNGVSRLALR
jgi:tRNA C32,U32 (ribose-2'-O)-methylase TrmJ